MQDFAHDLAVVFAGLAILLTSLAGQPQPRGFQNAYFEGKRVAFRLQPLARGQRDFTLGPWHFGARVLDAKPRDKRLNLYLVVPGEQCRAEDWAWLDHNNVINALPAGDAPGEWDVFWALALDPKLQGNFRNERDLILAGQSGFRPEDLFEFDDMPGAQVLRAFLNVESLEDLQPYRRKDGSLPRLLIVPAGFAVRASVKQIEEN